MSQLPDQSPFWSPQISRLNAYVPGEQPDGEGWIKLNTNENPYGPSPRAVEAMASANGDALRLYPDPNGQALKACIASRFGLTSHHVFLGNGSDEVLAHTFAALLRHGKPVLFPDVTYSFYPVYAALYGVEGRTVALNDRFEVDLEGYRQANGGILLANPNAPTGVALPIKKIEELLAFNQASVVVIDEAYVDFGAESAASLIARYPNLLVVQTFSKSRSLAGLRAAFALGNPVLIEALGRVKDSFNSYPLGRMALAGAQAAIEDEGHLREVSARVIASRESLVEALSERGFSTLPSKANFVLTRHASRDAPQLLQRLRDRRILVRHFAHPRVADCLRITIGTDEQCQALVQAIDAIESEFVTPSAELQA